MYECYAHAYSLILSMVGMWSEVTQPRPESMYSQCMTFLLALSPGSSPCVRMLDLYAGSKGEINYTCTGGGRDWR